MSEQGHSKPAPEMVLAKAVLKASEYLGLKQAELAKVLGVHRTTITRLKRNLSLDPQSKQGELALILVRISTALFTLTGGDLDWIRHFMHTQNKITGGIPAKQIESIQGLITVSQFVGSLTVTNTAY